MSNRKRWKDLSERTRKWLLVGGTLEGILKAAALVDLRRRPAEEVRGPKPAWALAIVLVNSVGAMPLVYFFLGRRKDAASGY